MALHPCCNGSLAKEGLGHPGASNSGRPGAAAMLGSGGTRRGAGGRTELPLRVQEAG